MFIMPLLLAIFIKLSPCCPDGVGSRLKLVRHVAGHRPLRLLLTLCETLSTGSNAAAANNLLLLLLVQLPLLLLHNLWQTVWGTPPLSTLSYIAGVFKSSIKPLVLVAIRNPDYESAIVWDKFVTVVTTRQRAECCIGVDVLTCAFTDCCHFGNICW